MEIGHHLAQINVARILAPLDDPTMADFVAQLATINALADASPGFVWRLQSETGDATTLRPYSDPRILVNMSVWRSFEELHAYVYRSAHTGVMRDRKRWFTRYDGPYYALWWIPAGTLPTVEEGKARIELLASRGASADAFWFGSPFPAPSRTTAGAPSASEND